MTHCNIQLYDALQLIAIWVPATYSSMRHCNIQLYEALQHTAIWGPESFNCVRHCTIQLYEALQLKFTTMQFTVKNLFLLEMPLNVKCKDPSYRTQTHISKFPTIISINTHFSATKKSYILSTCGRTYLPWTHLILSPGTCRPHPTRHTPILCCCRLCSIPWTYATKYLPVLSRTNTYFLFTVFGYFGFLITAFSATHLANGLLSSALRGGRLSFEELCCASGAVTAWFVAKLWRIKITSFLLVCSTLFIIDLCKRFEELHTQYKEIYINISLYCLYTGSCRKA